MKYTGVARKVDELGRVVIPVELRRTLGITEGIALDFHVDGKNIVLTYSPK
ncbi:AbrB/MazE/SpoVT family DNA-binding domain-containing protein, partial [Bacillus cereus]|nr:AbrB/MazE/SpoVT family DNA-binding domain-containing protein [Bacillus cereus]